MVRNVVLDAPGIAAEAEQRVRAPAEQVVVAAGAEVGAVVRVVLDAEPDQDRREDEPGEREQPEPEAGPDTAEDARPKLEPLEPRRKRGWFRRREREVPAPEAPEIELPKHVRLLPPSERSDRSSGEVAELFDLPEPEEHSRP